MNKERIAFIINPISGTGNKKKLLQQVDKLLDKVKYDASFFHTERVGHATEIARQLSAEGFPYVVAVGGDGTVNEVGQGLIHTQTAMGIIPCGSGNGLARHLKIPIDTKKAIIRLNTAKVITIDYGLANNRVFFCTCGVGFDAHISRQFSIAGKRGLKTYVEKSIKEYFNYNPEKYRLSNNEIDIEQEALLVSFANASQYGNNAYIAPHADLQDGLIDVCILAPFPLAAAPKLAVQLFSKKINKSPHIFSMQTDSIRLLRVEAGAFHYDGEAGEAGKELEIRVVPKGLKVLV